MKVKLTDKMQSSILKSLKNGTIPHDTLAELGGFKKQKYYDEFDASLLSKDAVQDIEQATNDPILNIELTKELKIILLRALQNGFIEVSMLEQYSDIELPLFREIDNTKLNKKTLQELKAQKKEIVKNEFINLVS